MFTIIAPACGSDNGILGHKYECNANPLMDLGPGRKPIMSTILEQEPWLIAGSVRWWMIRMRSQALCRECRVKSNEGEKIHDEKDLHDRLPLGNSLINTSMLVLDHLSMAPRLGV